jgi:hypothetical protein
MKHTICTLLTLFSTAVFANNLTHEVSSEYRHIETATDKVLHHADNMLIQSIKELNGAQFYNGMMVLPPVILMNNTSSIPKKK